MKHLKSFEIFESEGSSKLTPEMKRLADEIMGEVDVVIETDREKMKDWIVETGLQKVTDEYLDSDEFREFTEASVEESEEYRDRIAAGEEPEEVLEEMVDEAMEKQTYWDEFLEDTMYDASAMEEVKGEINYLTETGKPYYLTEGSTWEEVPGQSIPTIDVEGSVMVHGYQGSFLPFRIREITQGNFLPGDVIQEFQTDYQEAITGELALSRTNLIALDKGPIDAEWAFWFSDNSRLISLEGVRGYENLDIEESNFLSKKILEQSTNLTPGTKESKEYYKYLLEIPEFFEFDEEQVQFVLDRIAYPKGIQEYIDQNPEEMAIALKSVWKKIKSMDQFNDLQFPEKLAGEVDMMSDLHDIGL